MYTSIYQNSFIVATIVFVVLCVLFYLFEIGYTVEMQPDGKIVKSFSWKYPLAIALIVWVFWYFYLYPPADSTESHNQINTVSSNVSSNNKNINQHINMNNWN